MNTHLAKTKSKTDKVRHSRHIALKDGRSNVKGLPYSSSRSLGAFYSAAPVFGLGGQVQTKVTIGKANDKYEREADTVADEVMSGLPVPSISRISSGGLRGVTQRQEEKEEEEPVQELTVQREEEGEKEAEPVQGLAVQRQEEEREEAIQEKAIQRQEEEGEEKEEESVQALMIQRQEEEKEEEEPVQELTVQREEEGEKEEEPVQGLAVQRQEEEREEAIQEKAIQRQEEEEEEEPIQTQIVQCQEEEKEELIQSQGAERGTPGLSSMERAASQAIHYKSSGEPLNPFTRSSLESSMGVDLSDVRIHNDSIAKETAQKLKARAFTHKNDIWLGHGESQNNSRLMAHEASHVVQQTGGIHRQVVQRAGKKKKAAAGGAKGARATVEGKKVHSRIGTIDDEHKTISVPSIRIPPFKIPFTPGPFTLPKKVPGEKRETQQVPKWEEAAAKSEIINKKIEDASNGSVKIEKKGQRIYFFKLRSGERGYIIGNISTVKKALLRPFWNIRGKFTTYHVDHKKEYQLGGADEVSNMWLLKASTNMSSGSLIRNEVEKKTMRAANQAVGYLWSKEDKKNYKEIREQYAVTIRRTKKGKEAREEPGSPFELRDIWKAKPLEGLRPLKTKKELEETGFLKDGEVPTHLVIYTGKEGGGRRRIPLENGKPSENLNIYFGKNFYIKKVTYQRGKGGSVDGIAFSGGKKKSKYFSEVPLEGIELKELDWGPYGGYLPVGGVTKAAWNALKIPDLSPVEIQYAEISAEKGLIARGQILPTLPLFKDLKIDLVIDGERVEIYKTFSPRDLSFPGPIQVTDSSLTLFAGTRGLGLNGEVVFDIERVGTGRLKGLVSTEAGIGLEGSFNFDSKLFDPAKITLKYENNRLSGSGKLGIKKGKVKGIKSADVEAKVDGEKWEATGTVEPEIRGIEKGTLSAKYDPETGFEIGGSLSFSKDIPGIKGGSLNAKVKKKEREEGYLVKASGKADLDIPGIDASIKAVYDDGAFTAMGTVGYEKGLLKGSITAGVTNRPIDSESRPGGEPTDKLTAFGGGSVTVRIAPWLQGSIGLKLLPNGEIEVSGSVALPETLKLFDEKSLKKNIFTIDIDIPIVGVAVLGKRIGIFATIGGGLDINAGIGPGQLRKLGLSVTYNPDREEDTRVKGSAQLYIPAHAGLRLFVRGSLGAGIPIVSASAGLEVGGQLGIEGAVEAAVQVDWTPTSGLVLDAFGKLYAEPKFKFDITGFVLVEADLLFKTVELYSKEWELAAFEYGSGLRFGVKFPIHYEEGKPIDISFRNIEFEYPDIDPKKLLKGLIKRIA